MNNSEQNENYENIINWIFPGLTFYYRDTPLSPAQLSLYKPGMVLRCEVFTDTTPHAAGLAGDSNTRYLIASSKAADMAKVIPGTKWGLHTINRNSYFKVLDIYSKGDKTQILLLHVPKKWLDNMPADNHINLENEVVKRARDSFNSKSSEQPEPEQNQPEWLNRIAIPIGISPNNEILDPKGEYAPTNSNPDMEKMINNLSQAIKKLTNDTTDLNE